MAHSRLLRNWVSHQPTGFLERQLAERLYCLWKGILPHMKTLPPLDDEQAYNDCIEKIHELLPIIKEEHDFFEICFCDRFDALVKMLYTT